MVRLFAALLIAVSIVCFAARAVGETHKVSDIDTLADILANAAEPGDVVEIQPGTYVMDRKKISIQRSGTPESPIVIRGVIEDGKRPVFDGCDYNIQRGIFHFEMETHDVVMEDLELRNARGKGRQGADQPSNAAACYILGTNITMRNCYCHHNENGLFSTHESDYVLIEDCEIAFNGRELGIGDRFRTHGFYFNSKHQMVKNCYIHDQTDSENFKSRGDNTIFAFNWVADEVAYSLGLDSNSKLNTLWLGNVVIKRTYPGINQGRLLGVGDGTGVATGTLVALNNTFLTVFPRDFYLFTFRSSTTDVIFINNVFAGPGKVFMEKGGQGAVTGSNNWIQQGIADVPDTLTATISGDAPGFVDLEARDLRPREGSPLVNAGCSPDEYRKALDIVLQHAKSGSDASPSPEYLEALKEIEQSYPAYEPARGADTAARKVRVALDIGAFEFHGAVE